MVKFQITFIFHFIVNFTLFIIIKDKNRIIILIEKDKIKET